MVLVSISLLAALASTASARMALTAFGPEIPSAQMNTGGLTSFLTAPGSQHPLAVALDFAKSQSQADNGFGFVVKNHYKSDHNGVTHVYLKQTFNGVEVVNGDMNINVDKYGRVVSYGSSFFAGSPPEDAVLTELHLSNDKKEGQLLFKAVADDNIVSPAEAVISFGHFAHIMPASFAPIALTETITNDADSTYFGDIDEPVFKVGNVPFTADKTALMTRKYLIVNEPSYKILPVWDALFDMEDGEDYFNAQIQFHTGNVLQLFNWVKEARYLVYPIGVNDPSDGDRTMITHPEDKLASPLGWHDQGSAGRGDKFQTTIGNNVYAQGNPTGDLSDLRVLKSNHRPTGRGFGSNLTFDFPVDLSKEPDSYLNASIVNLFYWVNVMHDVFYQYGFDEKSGNFQEDNFGRGGRGGDAVIAIAQDGSRYNNAFFKPTPDGHKPRIQMHVWTMSRPKRDGDLEPGIIIHEYGHGVSSRLTGGASNMGCVDNGEAAGMGEGWGDIWSIMLRMRKEYKSDIEFGMGIYSVNRPGGIRPYPYSRSMKTNPQTYSYIKKPAYKEEHAQGSVWASILYEVYWTFVDAYGFNPDWYAIRNEGAKAGNLILMQLIVDGLKLQKCRPTFVDARNAILEADEIKYNGEHVCLLWKAFAKRGLGLNAKSGGTDDFSVPQECM